MLESEFLADTYGRDIFAVPDNSDDLDTDVDHELTVAAFTAGVDHDIWGYLQDQAKSQSVILLGRAANLANP